MNGLCNLNEWQTNLKGKNRKHLQTYFLCPSRSKHPESLVQKWKINKCMKQENQFRFCVHGVTGKDPKSHVQEFN